MDPTDEALLAAWRAGDRRAGEALFERHYEAIARFFRNKVSGDSSDLIQRTFLALIEAPERFRGDASFRTYLFAVAHNVLSRYYRQRRRDGDRVDFLEKVSVHDLSPSPPSILARRDEERLLLAALRRIPIEHQVVLELYFWERMRAPELARVLDLPEGTVRTRIRRAKQLLTAALRDAQEAPALIESTLSDLERWADQIRGGLADAPES